MLNVGFYAETFRRQQKKKLTTWLFLSSWWKTGDRLRRQQGLVFRTYVPFSLTAPTNHPTPLLCYGLRGIYGRFDSKIRFEIRPIRFEIRFERKKYDSQVPIINSDYQLQYASVRKSSESVQCAITGIHHRPSA